MKKRKKLLIFIPTALIVLVLATLLFAGNYLVIFAIVHSDNPNDVAPASVVTDENASVIAANRTALQEETQNWLDSCSTEKVQITSGDGLNLVGQIYLTDSSSHKWLIGVHGYTGKKEDYHNIAAQYAKRGYNILLPDMRSHGESEGTYIGMGWLEKDDVLLWIDLIIEMDPEAEIILHGTSMGGATVMMVSGEDLPDNVKGIVEDCGYTSVWDIFADELDYLFGLPTFPILNAAEFVGKIRAGYDFSEASSVEQVKKAEVPMLFIHGSEDNFVKTNMVYDVYEACPTVKDILVIDGAGHGEAYQMDPELYFETVFGFISENCITE